MRGLRIMTAVCAAGLIAAGFAARASGGQVVHVNASDAEYKVFCASCHGAGGKGDGPAAKSLRNKPADLTQLAKHDNGTFPTDRVFKIIEGRTPVAGHGGPDMPAWGAVFAQSRESQTPDEVKARIEALVKYLQGIQDTR